MSELWQDLRYGMRLMLKAPGFTIIAILTLALGIGANTAIFTLVNAALLRPLPYPEPDRLAMIFSANPARGFTRSYVSYQNFLDWREQSRSFAQMAAFNPQSANLAGGAAPERIDYAMTTCDLFAVLGVEPLLGRAFRPEDDRPGGGSVVILSHGFWQRYFGGDRGVIGRTLLLNGEANTIIGVVPARVHFPRAEIALWKPIGMEPEKTGARDSLWLQAVGRLRRGVTLEEAQSEMALIASRLEKQYPETNRGWGIELVRLHENQVAAIRGALVMLWTAVGLVLLIACANVGSLLLARAGARARELAIRAALGARRARLLRQLLLESLLLALAGGAAGLLLAEWGVDLLKGLGAVETELEIAPDARALLYGLALALLSGLIFGLAPALKAARTDIQSLLKEGGARMATGSHQRARRLLLLGEIALTVVLLVGAGVLIRSFSSLLATDPGFDASKVLTLRLAPPQKGPGPEETIEAYIARYRQERQRMAGFYDALIERIAALPGVEAAGGVQSLPLAGNAWMVDLLIEGSAERPPSALGRVVTPGFLKALKIPLRAGRELAATDGGASPLVAVMSESLARRYFPDRDPIGRRVRFGEEEGLYHWVTIVGVVGDVHYSDLASGPQPAIYVPFAQTTFGFFGDWGMSLAVRAAAPAESLVGAIRREVEAIDPTLPLYQVQTMAEVIGESLAARRAQALLLGALGALALALAAVGIYGVISYSVSQRRHEIGIRLALGARPRDVLTMVVREGMKLTLLGAAAGLLAALALVRLMGSLLYGVSAYDPPSFAGAIIALALTAAAACYIPARRATMIDPRVAMSDER